MRAGRAARAEAGDAPLAYGAGGFARVANLPGSRKLYAKLDPADASFADLEDPRARELALRFDAEASFPGVYKRKTNRTKRFKTCSTCFFYTSTNGFKESRAKNPMVLST